MAHEIRQPRSIKIRPSILREAHHEAIEVGKRLGEWIENAIEEKLERNSGMANRISKQAKSRRKQ